MSFLPLNGASQIEMEICLERLRGECQFGIPSEIGAKSENAGHPNSELETYRPLHGTQLLTKLRHRTTVHATQKLLSIVLFFFLQTSRSRRTCVLRVHRRSLLNSSSFRLRGATQLFQITAKARYRAL